MDARIILWRGIFNAYTTAATIHGRELSSIWEMPNVTSLRVLLNDGDFENMKTDYMWQTIMSDDEIRELDSYKSATYFGGLARFQVASGELQEEANRSPDERAVWQANLTKFERSVRDVLGDVRPTRYIGWRAIPVATDNREPLYWGSKVCLDDMTTQDAEHRPCFLRMPSTDSAFSILDEIEHVGQRPPLAEPFTTLSTDHAPKATHTSTLLAEVNIPETVAGLRQFLEDDGEGLVTWVQQCKRLAALRLCTLDAAAAAAILADASDDGIA